MSTGGFPLEALAREAGNFIGRMGAGGFMSAFANKTKWPLVLQQLDPVTGKETGLSYSFEEDDLPDDLELGTLLKTVKKEYPNNTTPDTQIIRTDFPDIELQGIFWCIDQRGRAPMDKAELLDAFALSGLPVRLTYMGGRLMREGHIVEYKYKILNETEVEWRMVIQVYRHGEQTAQGTGGVLTSTHGRVQDILSRLNSDGEALAEMRARIAAPNNHRGLRDDLKGAIPMIDEASGAVSDAKGAWMKNPSFEEMSVQQFKNFSNKLHTAAQATHRATVFVRSIPNRPIRAAESVLGWAGQHKRRKLLREASITLGRVKEDLKLMKKDADRIFKKKQKIHIVRDRDSLRSIAHQYYGDSNRWQEIARANSITDPNQIQGKRLIIP